MKSANVVTPRASAPHSWELRTWPPQVWPHTPKRADWISKAYRKELVKAKAMSRIGKTLVFSYARYTQWIECRGHHVVEYQSNNPTMPTRDSL